MKEKKTELWCPQVWFLWWVEKLLKLEKEKVLPQHCVLVEGVRLPHFIIYKIDDGRGESWFDCLNILHFPLKQTKQMNKDKIEKKWTKGRKVHSQGLEGTNRERIFGPLQHNWLFSSPEQSRKDSLIRCTAKTTKVSRSSSAKKKRRERKWRTLFTCSSSSPRMTVQPCVCKWEVMALFCGEWETN